MEEYTKLLTDKEIEETLKSIPTKIYILLAIYLFLAILNLIKLIIFDKFKK